MKALICAAALSAAVCGGDLCWAGPEWVERDDAGAVPATAQTTVGIGPIKTVKGTITAQPLLTGFSDFEDVFLVNISDPENFLITTTTLNPQNPDNPGAAEFDTVLYLFSAQSIIEGSSTQAFGLLGNNDTPLPLPGKAGVTVLSGSTITPNSTDGSGAQLIDPGLYYIVVSTPFTDPLSLNFKEQLQPIFTFKNSTEISGPDGPGGAFPLFAWTPEPPDGRFVTGFGGSYTIACEGVEFAVTGGLQASLDIRPGVCPNNFNVYMPGVLITALLGTPSFNVNDINTSTLQISRLDGVGSAVPVNADSFWYTDIATPFIGDQCDCHTLGADGNQDLYMKFDKQAMIDELNFDELECGAIVPLRVTGSLNDGTAFSSNDCIVIVD
jgi:hypothetical protein